MTQPIQWSSEFYDDELGVTYYNYRYFNMSDGNWLSRDSVAEVIGKNLYIYCVNNVVGLTDILGLLRAITHSVKLHRLIIRKVDKYGNIKHFGTNKVFSGNNGNNPDSVDVPDHGPIPPGKYYVIERQGGGRLATLYDIFNLLRGNDKRKWLALIADDNRIDDSTTIKGKVRSVFRMHAGTRSLGCITFMDKRAFEQARQFILDTDSETVENADGGEYVYYGILEVTAE